MKTYICATCKGEFEYVDDGSWTQEDALAENKEVFKDYQWDEQVLVCDNCYQAMPKPDNRPLKEILEEERLILRQSFLDDHPNIDPVIYDMFMRTWAQAVADDIIGVKTNG